LDKLKQRSLQVRFPSQRITSKKKKKRENESASRRQQASIKAKIGADFTACGRGRGAAREADGRRRRAES
jgi:hypothetical protein